MILITCWDLHCYVVHPTATERTDIPPLTLEDMEVVRQEISEKYFTQPPEISTPLHVFFGLPKEVGGSSGCQTLALAFQDSQKRNPTAAMEFLAWWLLEL